MIDGLCEYLWTHIPSTVAPRFVGDIPSQSEEGVSLSINNGEDNTVFFATNEVLYRPYVQCFIRTDRYVKGEVFASKVIQALDKFQDLENGILCVVLQGSPTYLGKNEDKLHEFQLMFRSVVLEKE